MVFTAGEEVARWPCSSPYVLYSQSLGLSESAAPLTFWGAGEVQEQVNAGRVRRVSAIPVADAADWFHSFIQ